MKMSRNKTLMCVFLTAVFMVMYLMNRFTPLFCDDLHYVFIFGTLNHIQTLGDIFRSQCDHYLAFNGRFVVHCLVQLFDGILGKGVFNVFNALAFVVFLVGTAMVTTRDRAQHYKVASVAFALVLLVMAAFKYGFLWLSGSFNYLWVATALLFFMLLMEREQVTGWARVPALLYAFVCGWSNEAFIVGLGAAYFFYFLFHRDRLTRYRLWMMVAFALGALLVVSSPGAFHRATHTSLKMLSVADRLVNMYNLKLFFVLLAIVLVRVIVDRKALVKWIAREQVLIVAVLVELAFVMCTAITNSHSRLGIEFFSLLLILKSVKWERVNVHVVTAANVAVLAIGACAVVTCSKCYAVCQQELQCVARGDSLVVTSSPVKMSSCWRRFVLDYYGTQLADGIDDDKSYGNNDFEARYYGYENKFVCFLPKLFMDDLKAHPQLYDRFRTLDELPFYAVRLQPGQDAWYVELIYEPSRFSSWPWPLNRLLVKLSGDVEYQRPEVKVVTIDGERYALVLRRWPSQDDRLKEIRLVDYPEWSKPALTSEPEEIRRHFFQ